jgi:hypothetical protein
VSQRAGKAQEPEEVEVVRQRLARLAEKFKSSPNSIASLAIAVSVPLRMKKISKRLIKITSEVAWADITVIARIYS